MRNDVEAPAFITTKFLNVSDDYQDGSERSDRLATESNAEQIIELPLGFTPQEAKRIADVLALDVQASMNSLGTLALQPKYATLEPTDVVLVTAEDGSSFRMRLQKRDEAGIIRFDGVFDDATIINSTALTSDDYESSSSIRLPAATVYELMDIPILRDADNESGHYVAMTGAGDYWPGAALMKSPDGISFEERARVTERGVVGSATTVLGNWAGPVFVDEHNAVTVDVGLGTLFSCSHEELLAGTGPTLLIGAEVIPYKTATLISPGIYTITGLLRGRRGTEWAMGSHVAHEKVVLLRPQGLRRVTMQTTELNLERIYRGITLGKSISSAFNRPFTNTGVGLKPFSVRNVRGSRTSGNLTITWDRRTRLSENWLLGSVPLGEAAELYAVEILNALGTTVVRTITATAATASYSAADQTTDFGSPQAAINVRVYQVSDVVARGYSSSATV